VMSVSGVSIICWALKPTPYHRSAGPLMFTATRLLSSLTATDSEIEIIEGGGGDGGTGAAADGRRTCPSPGSASHTISINSSSVRGASRIPLAVVKHGAPAMAACDVAWRLVVSHPSVPRVCWCLLASAGVA